MSSSIELTKEQRFELAIQAFQKNQADQRNSLIRKLALQYDLPRSTLQAWIQNGQSKQTFATKRQILKPEQEKALKRYIIQLTAWDWPSRVNQVRFLAKKLYSFNHFTSPLIKLEVNWVQKLLSRRTQLTSIFSIVMNKKRMTMHNIKKLTDWFVLYEEIVKIYKIE